STVARPDWKPPAKVQSAADGVFAFVFDPPAEWSFQVTLVVEHRARVRCDLDPLARGAVADLGDVVLPTNATVRGRVVDTKGAPQAGRGVSPGYRVVGPGLSGRRYLDAQISVMTDALGWFELCDIAPGRFWLPYVPGGSIVRSPRQPQTLDLAPGADVAIELV